MDDYSVLMTVYEKDNPVFVKASIDSILAQTKKTNDFVVVCDGPIPNELATLLCRYQENYPTLFNVIKLEKNVGLGAALKTGLIYCKNEIVARMDDDDVSRPNRCESELSAFSSDTDLDICGSYVSEFENDITKPVRIKNVPITHEEILKFSRRRNPFNHSSVMFKKSKIIEVGNYSDMRTNQDVELWVRALNNGLKGMNIDSPLVDFRFDSNTYKRRKQWKNVKLLIKVWKGFWKNKYCSFFDYLHVLFTQIVILVLPTGVIRWAYNHLR